jgi:uncharacterized OB-fold protein
MTDPTLSFAGNVPDVSGEEKTFFDFCRQRRLAIQYCATCDSHVFYPRSVCPTCWESSLEWVDASGRATVFTFTIQHRESPGYEGQAPYVLAMVELEEGVRMMTRIVAEPERVTIGMPVHVAFATIGDGDFTVPVFLADKDGDRHE